MPPFGNFFGMGVIVDPELARDKYIYFNAGNHAQTVRLAYKDFLAMVKPGLHRWFSRASERRHKVGIESLSAGQKYFGKASDRR